MSLLETERLIGEQEVLTAVTAEYLDEASPKKDTSAATVCLGRVLTTNYRFQFMPDWHEYGLVRTHLLQRTDAQIASYFTVPLGCITRVKKKHSVIEIRMKDLRHLSFRFDVIEVDKIFNLLNTYVFPDKLDYLFAFYHRLSEDYRNEDELIPFGVDWDIYNDRAEWKRQGVLSSGKWRISDFNKGFEAIETYPELLVVPSTVPDGVLHEATSFRSLGRIPVLCWLHASTGATICRSSQPKIGMSRSSSAEDEQLVAGIASSSLHHNILHIIDCRPMTNAFANRAIGYGVESSGNYKNCEVAFMNIPNIHSMRESMKKLRTLCASSSCDNLQWLGNVEDTKWLLYIRQLLKASVHVTSLVRSGESVLLHCSHGWDRTSQIVSIAQLILDPYYRTWQGFQVLIDKEWLSFGHPFQMRYAHGEKSDTQESPIFIQFLDCVWQLVHNHPTYFEFNEGLLLLLADALHSCRFGTFLLDCKKHRHEAKLDARTVSIWTWINGFRPQLTEASFVPGQTMDPPVTGLLKRVELWESMFLRWSGQPLLHESSRVTDFFVDNKLNIPSWQLPQTVIDALNSQLAVKYKEVELVQRLRDRVAVLEQRLSRMST